MIRTFNDWRLAKKMLVSFGLLGAMICALGVTSFVTIRHLVTISDRHVDRGIAGMEALGRMSDHLREHRIIIFSQMNAVTPQEVSALEDRFEKNKQGLAQAIQDFEPLADTLKPRLDLIKADVEKLEEVNKRIFESKALNGAAATLPMVKGEGKERSTKTIEDVAALVKAARDRSEAADDAGEAAAQTAVILSISLLLLAMGALAGIWRLLARSVATPLAEVSSVTKLLANGGDATVPHRERKDELGDVAQAVELFRQAAVSRAEADGRIAAEQKVVTSSLQQGLAALTAGDLTADISTEYPPAYVELKNNFNKALAALRELIGAVTQSAASISTGSGEIAHASEDLARRTEGNAASLEETSASLSQIDERLKATAVAASRTVERADQAIATVGGGRAIAEEAVQAMGRVSDSAKGIDSVIEGLDKIAFQTRVLAMNAAVEAGRAGEAGRGFAVVADLVSALAMRAEEEAGRARDQLTATQADIGSAVEAVQKVDGALADISGDVGQVHELLGTMAADNQAQSSAITQISAAIGSMDQSTQQNAAMVEETSAAARNLTSEVSALTEQAARFRTSKDGRQNAPAPLARTGAKAPPARKNYALPAAKPQLVTAGADEDWNSF